jgi:hypothetical protein
VERKSARGILALLGGRRYKSRKRSSGNSDICGSQVERANAFGGAEVLLSSAMCDVYYDVAGENDFVRNAK